jgi:periplasmic protein TonB
MNHIHEMMPVQRLEPMRRQDLASAAAVTIALIAGIAWWGEQTRPISIHLTTAKPPTEIAFTIEPDPPVPVEMTVVSEKPVEETIARPELQDTPMKPTADSIVQAIEPPHPVVNLTMYRIPTGGEGMGNHAFEPGQLDQPPVAFYQASPRFPQSMKRAGLSGEVMVDFIVDPSGKVRNVVAIHSNLREFEEPACSAVGKWKFKPGRKGGRAVFTHMQVPIVFSLSENGEP